MYDEDNELHEDGDMFSGVVYINYARQVLAS